MATLTERFAELSMENVRLKDMVKNVPERCAEIAENEPEPNGEVPEALRNMPLGDALRLTVRSTKALIANRIREAFDLHRNTVNARVSSTSFENSDGVTTPGIIVTCTRCNYSVHVYGRSERSTRRGCSMLRQECPRKESNFYVEVE